MPLAFHDNAAAQFEQQSGNAHDHILPFVEEYVPLGPDAFVLEVGCAEGGVLAAFMERGCRGIGIDLDARRIELGQGLLRDRGLDAKGQLLVQDLYDEAFLESHRHQFHLIVLKDVIEHLHDRRKFLRRLKLFLRPGGVVFFGFPPWMMPFGGHQQIAESKWGKLPYLHLLPRPLYRRTLEALGEPPITVATLMEVVDTRLTIERFHWLLDECHYRVVRHRDYLVNPIYERKFGLQPRQQAAFISRLPWVRNFLTTCCYSLAQPI